MPIITKPWLPTAKVKTVLISDDEKEGRATLENMGIRVITTVGSDKIAPQVSTHPDMLFLHIEKKKCVVIDKKLDFVLSLKNIGFNILEAQNTYSEKYPNDIGLNCLILGKTVIGNIEHIDSAVKEILYDFEFINVSQGYTKCSLCVVDDNSLITEDQSIYQTLKNKFDVLKIESGSVNLRGYNYGFFGGCTGLLSKNLLAVNGELKTHKSHKEIAAFLKERKVDYIELKAGNLTDIGSIVPLEEK